MKIQIDLENNQKSADGNLSSLFDSIGIGPLFAKILSQHTPLLVILILILLPIIRMDNLYYNVIYSKLRNRKSRLQEVSLHNVIDFLPLIASAETHHGHLRLMMTFLICPGMGACLSVKVR